jgi:predicted SAM-dependent methyltransferase
MTLVSKAKAIAGPVRAYYRASGIYRLRHSSSTRDLFRSAPRPLKLHLGCGKKILSGWLNIDLKKRPGVAVMRLPQGLKKFADHSVAFAYSSHMLEHLDYPDDALSLCREFRRVLMPGGPVRFVVPGIERIIRAYVANDAAFFEEQRSHHPA